MGTWFLDKIGKPIPDWLAEKYGSVILAVLLMFGASFWTWSAEHEYLPIFLVGLGTLVAVIWGVNGVIWLRAQTRPSKAKMTFDYSYGVALDEIFPSHDRENVANVAPGPLKYKVERVDVVIGDRIRALRDTMEHSRAIHGYCCTLAGLRRLWSIACKIECQALTNTPSFTAIRKTTIQGEQRSAFILISSKRMECSAVASRLVV
jgi:hypothetical protein